MRLVVFLSVLILSACTSWSAGGVAVYSGGLGYEPFYGGAYLDTNHHISPAVSVVTETYATHAQKASVGGYGWRSRGEVVRTLGNWEIGAGGTVGQQRSGYVQTFYSPTLVAGWKGLTVRVDLPDNTSHRTWATIVSYKIRDVNPTFEPVFETVFFDDDVGIKFLLKIGWEWKRK